jgi:protein-histidine pros-kinase
VALKVFISHSSKDKPIADAICNHLESAGVRCWIAPRDIAFGADWTDGIMRGIASCRVFVLVFSENANDSEHVRREVAKAFSLGLAVIPFRTESVSPTRSLGYFLETVHWLDAITPPLQNHLGALTEQVKQLLGDDLEPAPGGRETTPAEDPAPTPPALPKQPDRRDRGMAKPSRKLGWLLKFNLAFVPLLIAGICVAAVVIRNQLRDNSQQEVLESAKLMLETTRASRTYTDQQINPLLERQQNEIEKSSQMLRKALETAEKVADTGKRQAVLNVLNQAGINNESTKLAERQFHPQSIPFFAATEAFNYFRQAHPDYAYKEAALNPTNPRDRTVDWEADVVSVFRKNPAKTEFIGNRETPSGPSLFVSAPIKADESCLECHSTPDKAPAEIVKLYGTANGFGWKEGDIIGAQIVSVPAMVSEKIADSAFRSILVWLIGIAVIIFVLVNVALLMVGPRPKPRP